ncbi:MAG: ABC transporter ATP-binding protein [Tissierella sp.]|uniref:ABC transporter ATP-binding protein n=1 Tax=Tissierella sp. TaxID=41274 RepID=UPI003F96A706
MLLEMKNITKAYGPVLANDNVDLSLNKGEILAVVGENGAGKSTIMKILYGLEEATSGEIYLNGELQNFKNPQAAISKGIGMVQQHFMLFNPFTVAENIVYGNEPKNRGIFFDRKKAIKAVENLSKEYGLDIDPRRKTKDCPVGLQQRIEILKVLYQDANIIIFDEPSAVLTPQEVEELLKTIRNLAALGKSIILITHKLQEVMAIADRVLVMRRGKYIKEMNIEDTNIEEISYLMVGRELVDKDIPKRETEGKVLEIEELVVKGAHNKNVIDHLSMNIKGGEIVGIAGVSGNGQSELIKVITGLQSSESGNIILEDNDIFNKSVSEIREKGCACIPEDRYLWGCAKEANLIETGIMAHHRNERFSNKGLLKNNEIEDYTRDVIDRYDVRCSGVKQKAGQLSGGNIQKLIVAREVEQNSRLLIAAEPTRGVDIGAMEFIHGRLLEKREKGDAVLLVSSELTEIMKLSDRIYVMYDGKITGEFTRENVTAEKLGLLMMGGKSND